TAVWVSFDDGGRWQPLQMALPGTLPPVAPAAAASPSPRRAPASPVPNQPEGAAPLPSPTPSPAPEERVTGRLPIVPITDLVIKGNDLVVSTQGRAFW